MKYASPRQFFQNLSWDSVESNTKIFSDDEMESLPLKWLKYLLLEKVSISASNTHKFSIHRFLNTEINATKQKCYLLFSKNKNEPDKSLMIVVKLVSMNQAGQLSNYRLYSVDEIDKTLDTVKKRIWEDKKIKEIWLCVSSVSQTTNDYGGRISFDLTSKYQPTILEMVWYTSPRLIENFSQHGFEYPFMRLSKLPCKKEYKIVEIYVPTKFSSTTLVNKLKQNAQELLYFLYTKQDNIKILQSILSRAGSQELSLEFKKSFGGIHIIDWDTEIETTLNNYK